MIINTTETNSSDKILPSDSWLTYDDLPEATPEETERATELFKQNRDNFLRQQELDIRNEKIAAGKKILQAFRNKCKTTIKSGGTDPNCTSPHSSLAFKSTSSSSNITSVNAFIKIEQATSTESALAYDAPDFGITTSKNFTFVSPPPPTASFGSAGADVSIFSFNNLTTIFQPCTGIGIPVSTPPATASFGSAGADGPDNPDRGRYAAGTFFASSPPATASFGSAGADSPDNPDRGRYAAGTFIASSPPATASFCSAGADSPDNPDSGRYVAENFINSSPPATAGYGSTDADCPDNPNCGRYAAKHLIIVPPSSPTANFGSAGAEFFDNVHRRINDSEIFITSPSSPTASFSSTGVYTFITPAPDIMSDNPDNPRKPASDLWAYIASRG